MQSAGSHLVDYINTQKVGSQSFHQKLGIPLHIELLTVLRLPLASCVLREWCVQVT